ncbi:hypothetical protein [Cognatiyoonia sp. IB215182]|uniref:hypothetical protein n=1 Tax=Cognatiyoonia sp. IB215182 TaxID=3097353 RepID=UPI002A105FCC|nr:hypothetical protein [Cognatiyoonia sp. IB215182]MDX8352669.1 hypothetical protein [Cognatiyoonia sp. IB215182]
MRRFGIIVFSVLLALLALGFFLLPPLPITVTQAQINTAIADRLPFETQQDVGSAVINAGTVTLSAGNRVETEWAVTATSPMYRGDVAISAALQIQYQDGAFYLRDLDYREIALDFAEEGATETTRRDLGDLLVQGARTALQAVTDDAVATTAFDPELTSALKELFGRILQTFLNAFPIYDLRSAGGNIALAALVLDEVRIDDGVVTVTFAAQRLISQVAVAVLFVLVLLLFAGRNAPFGRS